MSRHHTGRDVYDEAVARMEKLYRDGHRVLVSFSAGKDSTCCLHVCRDAAERAGRLPVEVIMRDEEIMYPGVYEYAERVAKEPWLEFHWIYACQPIVNVFHRESPYFWVFDPNLSPEQWVRKPPAIAYRIADLNIQRMTTPERFPVAPGKFLVSVIGLRAQESLMRFYSVHAARGFLTQPNASGVRHARPIYDWMDGDVWKAIKEREWDYARTYDTLFRMGLPSKHLRVAPPTLNAASLNSLSIAAAAWPKWFDRVAARLPGVRTAAMFGDRTVKPHRRREETWEQCFWRECVKDAPGWVAERAPPSSGAGVVGPRRPRQLSAARRAAVPDVHGQPRIVARAGARDVRRRSVLPEGAEEASLRGAGVLPARIRQVGREPELCVAGPVEAERTDELREAIASLPWRATDYGGSPHEYVMAHWSPRAALFAWRMGAAIAEDGYSGEWGGRTWRYLDLDGFTYWMMPKPSWPFVVNRRPTDRMQP